MKVCIWCHEIYDSNGNLIIGGVQTYVIQLITLINKLDGEAVIVTPYMGKPKFSFLATSKIVTTTIKEWYQGLKGSTIKAMNINNNEWMHIVANAHATPSCLGVRKIGIQHGIYWDRPTAKVISKIFPVVTNFIRSWKGAAIVNKYSALVCVDLIFPTMAACIFSPIPWSKLHYIPNSAPVRNSPPKFFSKINRIVFSRRFEKHRGTRIFADAVLKLLNSGWEGEVHLVGKGPEESFLQDVFKKFDNVFIYHLPFEERLNVFTEDALVVIPSLSTEGTSLTCVEAWSCGSLVIASSVGGLSNLVIDRHNGLICLPTAEDLYSKICLALSGSIDVENIKRNGFLTHKTSFTSDDWEQKWGKVLASI